MNKLAQAEVWAVILGLVGAVFGWIMASRMEAGFIMKIITTVLTFVACYTIVYFAGSR